MAGKVWELILDRRSGRLDTAVLHGGSTPDAIWEAADEILADWSRSGPARGFDSIVVTARLDAGDSVTIELALTNRPPEPLRDIIVRRLVAAGRGVPEDLGRRLGVLP